MKKATGADNKLDDQDAGIVQEVEVGYVKDRFGN